MPVRQRTASWKAYICIHILRPVSVCKYAGSAFMCRKEGKTEPPCTCVGCIIITPCLLLLWLIPLPSPGKLGCNRMRERENIFPAKNILVYPLGRTESVSFFSFSIAAWSVLVGCASASTILPLLWFCFWSRNLILILRFFFFILGYELPSKSLEILLHGVKRKWIILPYAKFRLRTEFLRLLDS